jgi:uncharacterized protein (DUF1501 family)
MKACSRRRFLRTTLGAGASLAAAGGGLVASRLALGAPASGGSPEDARLVLVLLRGALDGLAAVPPYADPAYATLRRELALGAPGSGAGAALRLDGRFGLHPALLFLHERYGAGELAVLHAVATPYRERSHFDAQDLLENGGTRPHQLQSGWLNRALAALERAPYARTRRSAGVALGANVPLVMRGPAEVASWSPSRLGALDEDTLQRVQDLYAPDPVLAQRLADALASDAIANDATAGRAASATTSRRAAGARLEETLRAAAGFLARPDGARVAVLETSGWDTHANQGSGAQGPLALRLAALDAGLRSLRDALGAAWARTAVLLVTEFGRTAAINGTRGTDHGTGAAAWLLGGAVAGGRVIADWPGLGPAALHEGRDLRPTLDLRAALKGVLAEHLHISARTLDAEVFPGSEGVRALPGLVRGA